MFTDDTNIVDWFIYPLQKTLFVYTIEFLKKYNQDVYNKQENCCIKKMIKVTEKEKNSGH